jgi:NADH-quinone oxidoreductase subunit I
MGLVKDIKNLVIGLFTTGKHLGRHAITLQYPTQKWPMPERSRGIVVLLSDKETGELNCTTCLLCMKACPTAAIQIHYDKGEKGKRILNDFMIDLGLCCFCGLCEEACNFAAIKMDTKYEFSTENKDDLVWHTAKLQDMGRNTPYEPIPKKKPVEKPPVTEVAAPAEANTKAKTGTPAETPAKTHEPDKKEGTEDGV